MVYATTNAQFECSNDGWVAWTQETVETILVPLAGLNWIVATTLSSMSLPDLAVSYLYGYEYLTAVLNFSAYFGSGAYYFLLDVEDGSYATQWCDAAGYLAAGTEALYPYVQQLKSQFGA